MTSESRELRRWLAAGAAAVRRARERLDEINVFPVPDSDTGTNMYLTLQEGNRAVAKLPARATHREVVAAFARGALLGARGNSGVIVSQYLSAFLRHIDRAGGLSGASASAIASSLGVAADAAYGAVGAPVEGTILSVARAAAEGAKGAAGGGASREETVVAAVDHARRALRATYADLPAAAAAGVVDAGAAGLVLQLEMLAETLAGADALAHLGASDWELAPSRRGVVAVPSVPQVTGGAYEVMFVTRVDDAALEPARRELGAALGALGDSVAVTGTHGLIQSHVHTDHPDQAVLVGIERGARQIVVCSLALGHGAEHGPSRRGGTGVVALTSCPGVAPALADAGAVVLVVPDPERVKRRELRRAVRDASDRGVVVVAGNEPLRRVAKELSAKKALAHVRVLDAAHEAQVVAAVAAGALATPGEPLAEVMAGAVACCEVGQSTADGAPAAVGALLDERAEVVTLVLGDTLAPDAPAVAAVRDVVSRRAPAADVQVYQGRQRSPQVLIGVERQ